MALHARLLRKKRPGDPIRAEDWNAVVEMLKRTVYGPGVSEDHLGWYVPGARSTSTASATGIKVELYKWQRWVIGTPFLPMFKYAFRQIDVDLSTSPPTWAIVTGGIHGDISGEHNPEDPASDNDLYALNLFEGRAVADGRQATGVDTSSGYPDGFETYPLGGYDGEPPLPDSGDCAVYMPALIYPATDIHGTTYYYFSAIPTDWGSC